MTKLTKCERVQIGSYRKCQKLVVKVKKIDGIWTRRYNRTVGFFANRLYLIVGILSKNAVN